MDWLELAVFSDMGLLQQQSEGAELAVPASEEGLRHMVSTLFPRVLGRVQQSAWLPEWRTHPPAGPPEGRRTSVEACHDPRLSWRQSLVLSYATWVRAYLDVRNKNLLRPGDVSPNDLELARLLLDLNLDCFPSVFGTSDAGPKDRLDERARFVISAAAIRLNLVAEEKAPARPDRDRLRHETDDLLRDTIFALDQPALGSRPEGSEVERLVFGRSENNLLRTARQLKARLDKLPSH